MWWPSSAEYVHDCILFTIYLQTSNELADNKRTCHQRKKANLHHNNCNCCNDFTFQYKRHDCVLQLALKSELVWVENKLYENILAYTFDTHKITFPVCTRKCACVRPCVCGRGLKLTRAVSYTHLDVYKRQVLQTALKKNGMWRIY